MRGLPPGKSKLDYLMTVRNGQAALCAMKCAGEKPASDGQFDLRMLGLFAYDGKITGPGQKLPGANFRLNIGKGSARRRHAQHHGADRPENGGDAAHHGYGAGQANVLADFRIAAIRIRPWPRSRD